MIRINEVFFCELYWNISFFLNNHDIDACFRINAQIFTQNLFSVTFSARFCYFFIYRFIIGIDKPQVK